MEFVMTDFFAIFRDELSVFALQAESSSVRSSCFAHQVALIDRPFSQLFDVFRKVAVSTNHVKCDT